MEFKKLKTEGIRVIAIDTPYLNEWGKVQDSSLYNMIADIFITLKAHMAQQERERTVLRINQGVAVARSKGTTTQAISLQNMINLKKMNMGTWEEVDLSRC